MHITGQLPVLYTATLALIDIDAVLDSLCSSLYNISLFFTLLCCAEATGGRGGFGIFEKYVYHVTSQKSGHFEMRAFEGGGGWEKTRGERRTRMKSRHDFVGKETRCKNA